MEPRPILLVKEPLTSGEKFHSMTADLFAREGYIVLRCGAEDFNDVKVLAPHPFTQEDVTFLRQIRLSYEQELVSENVMRVVELADRIEGLL